ncbi:MAG TPA: hypothetical protein VIX12_06830 [Candidatus Binataceae bacterium]
MPRKDRLRRVVILCGSFARNLAYYRVGWSQEHRHLLDPAKSDRANFWNTVNGNFVYMCVLEWCKLFADKRGKHYWGKIVADPAGFKAGLLRHLGLDEGVFQTEINDMLELRDKHIAHLDSDPTGDIPRLDVPKKAVWFYHDYIANQEAKPSDLAGLPVELDTGYKQCEDEAKAVYQR